VAVLLLVLEVLDAVDFPVDVVRRSGLAFGAVELSVSPL